VKSVWTHIGLKASMKPEYLLRAREMITVPSKLAVLWEN